METESDLIMSEAAKKILERKRYSVAPEYGEHLRFPSLPVLFFVCSGSE